MARTLRSVSPDEQPARKAPQTVAQAVESGTRREQLVAMRSRIAKAIDDPNIRGADLAALSRRLLEVSRDVEAIDAAAEQEAAESATVHDEAFTVEAL